MNKFIWILSAFLLIGHGSSSIDYNPLFIYYTVTNTAQTPVRVYRPGGPLEGIFYSDYVHVTFQGKELKRRAHYPSMDRRVFIELPKVSERAFVLLNPGESVTSSFDLANQFDFTKVGTYHVEMYPVKQFGIQNLLDSGTLEIQECEDYKLRQRSATRRYLNYEICGFEEEIRKTSDNFHRDFIRIPKPSIELPSSLTLDPKREQLKPEPVTSNNDDVPSFGLLGSASLVIEITSENIPHGTRLEVNFTLSYCEDDDRHEYRYRVRDTDFYSDEDSEYEGLECSEFEIWKYRKTMELKRLIGRFEDFINQLPKLIRKDYQKKIYDLLLEYF